MAKNKNNQKNNGGLKSLTKKDLRNRVQGKQKQVYKLQNKLKTTTDKTERAAIKAKIDKKQTRLNKLNKVLKKKDFKNPAGTRAQQLDRIYSSDAFQMLSPANQQLVQGIVNSYTPDELMKLKLSKKKIALIEADAREAAKKTYKGSIKEFDQDREEALRGEVGSLERLIAEQKKRLEADLQKGDNMSADQRIMAIEDLKTALTQAKDRYEVEATRKNDYLQNQLRYIQEDLNTSTTRADEDSIIQLRQLERTYKSNLRDLQSNMAQRGLAFSGIRFQEESELGEEYEDNRTTAEIERDRRIEDAQREAARADEGLDVTRQELEDLLYNYGIDQQSAVRTAESSLGTGTTKEVISGGDYTITGGKDPKSYLYGGLKGTINIVDEETKRAYEDSINKNLEQFERSYGTDLLNKKLGGAMKATENYAGYKPIGQLSGTEEIKYQRDKKDAKDQKAYDYKRIKSSLKDKALATKLLGVTQ